MHPTYRPHAPYTVLAHLDERVGVFVEHDVFKPRHQHAGLGGSGVARHSVGTNGGARTVVLRDAAAVVNAHLVRY